MVKVRDERIDQISSSSGSFATKVHYVPRYGKNSMAKRQVAQKTWPDRDLVVVQRNVCPKPTLTDKNSAQGRIGMAFALKMIKTFEY